MRRERTSYAGALFLSLVLHVVVLGAGLVHWPWLGKTRIVQVTPVTLMTSTEMAKLMAAEQSEKPQQAQAEETVAEAPPEAPAPEPEPKPPEPAPAPKPTPVPKTPTPVPPKKLAENAPGPKAPPPKPVSRPDPGFDLDALAKELIKSAPKKAVGGPVSSAPKGPTQAERDIAQREAEGRARAAVNDFNSLMVDQLRRAWHVNCAVEGVQAVRIRVRVELARDGSLTQAKLVDYPSDTAIADPVVRAAATRALAAVSASAPFRGVPPVEAYDQWKSRIVAFVGKDAC